MNRRHAIKSLATSVGAFIALPTWANSWSLQTIQLDAPFLSFAQENLLIDIVSTLIPEGEKPGAKSLGVPVFIQKMVTDCYEPKEQEAFKTGLEAIEKAAQLAHNQSFTSLTTLQKEEILRGASVSTDTPLKEFYASLKNLTLQGYTTSEYVMVNHYKYEMAPGHFYGCVPV
jgi:hypothetical protein